MKTADFFFSCVSRFDLQAELVRLGLFRENPATARSIDGTPGSVDGALRVECQPADPGVSLDYIGALVDVPATWDASTFPPVMLTPPVMFAGERANLRLTGPDAETRAASLAAATWADGVTLLPPGAVPDAQRKRWGDDGFPYVSPLAPLMEEHGTVIPPPAPTLAQAKRAAIERLAERRWQIETAGVLFGGSLIATDRESQGMLTGALAWTQRNPAQLIKWKAEGGFVDVDAATIGALADAVGAHVQACFAREAELAAAIENAADVAAVESLTQTSANFWP